MSCPQAKDAILRIEKMLANKWQNIDEKKNFQDVIDGWTVIQKGHKRWYGRALTYNGAAQTLVLPFINGVAVRRIAQTWNDATAKDFYFRVYGNVTNQSSVATVDIYSILDVDTTNTATAREISWNDGEMSFPPGGRLIYVATGTNAKVTQIQIQVDVL